LLEPINDLPWPLQPHQVSAEHDAVKTVVYKDQPSSKQLGEQFHRSPPDLVFDNKIIGPAIGAINRAGGH
jgi:hypothetical protein